MWDQLLDINTPLDIKLLDSAAVAMFQSNQRAAEILFSIQNRPDWLDLIDKILLGDCSLYLKNIELVIFGTILEKRWETFPNEQKEYYRNLIASFITNSANSNASSLLPAANKVLNQILMYEWPERWPDFISNILETAMTSPQVCQNCFVILRELVENFTDFAEEMLTTVRQAEMSSAFFDQFGMVLNVIQQGLTSGNEDLILEILKSLKVFLGVIFLQPEQLEPLLTHITQNLLPDPKFMLQSMSVLSSAPQFSFDISVAGNIFNSLINCLSNIFVSDDMYNITTGTSVEPQEFVHCFVSVIVKFIPSLLNYPSIEQSEQYASCLIWLYKITEQSESDERKKEDFVELIDFWHIITRTFFYNLNTLPKNDQIYIQIFQLLRRFLLVKMIKPSNPNSRFIDEDGIHYHRFDVYTQESSLYNLMRECLVYLYHISPEDTFQAINERLQMIKNNLEIDSIPPFSYAIGAIQGALNDNDEFKLIADIIQTLMTLNSSINNMNNKPIIICGILYICSKYGQMISRHYDLLKVIIHKMLDFSRIQNEPIQTAAVNALFQISKYSSSILTMRQENEEKSFLETILLNISEILSPLTRDNIIVMIEFISSLIMGVIDENIKKGMFMTLSKIANYNLKDLAQNLQFDNAEWYNNVIFVIDCDRQIASYQYHYFAATFNEISPMILHIYTNASQELSSISNNSKSDKYNALVKLKLAIIHLYALLIDIIKNVSFEPVICTFMNDYASSNVKTPEILGLLSSFFQQNETLFKEGFQAMFDNIIMQTIEIIKNNMFYTEIWIEFSKFMNTYFNMPPDFLISNMEYFNIMFEFLQKACAHPNQNVSESAVMTLQLLVSSNEFQPLNKTKKELFNLVCVDSFVLAFKLLSDGNHKFLFNNLTNFLRRQIQYDSIQERLPDIMQELCEVFSNRPPSEIHELLIQMMDTAKTQCRQFKNLIRDFLILTKKIAPWDPSLYQKEVEELTQQIEQKKAVPGLVPDEKTQQSDKIAASLAEAFNFFDITN